MSRAVRYGGSLFVACLALYLALISTVEPLEWAIGAGAALLGAGFGLGAHRVADPAVDAPRTASARALRLPVAWSLDAVRECGLLLRVVAVGAARREVGGRFERVRPARAVRSATAAFVLSATPGAYAVDLDDAGVLTVHTLPLGRSRTRRVITAGGRAR
ncbi:hypothetical protein [Embleya sp. MST-111070]|uniref:hypothetical protein n=1 Tax=Embleya sp. MST-111070 TaxID=3398231 RepID=UPI003F740DB7